MRGADGIVFVVDSDPEKQSLNRHAFTELQDDLSMLGSELTPPILTQFNKRDRKDASGVKPFGDEPALEAVASDGVGVRETLLEMSETLWQAALKRSDFPEGIGLSAQDFRSELAAHIAKP